MASLVQRSGAAGERVYVEHMSTGAVPDPVRHLMAQLDELRLGDAPGMGEVGRLLLDLAADEEFFAPLIAQMPAESPAVRWLATPERGPRLVLVHRPEGVMAYTHSHRCRVAIAPVRGVETHQHWDVVRHAGSRAELSLAPSGGKQTAYHHSWDAQPGPVRITWLCGCGARW